MSDLTPQMIFEENIAKRLAGNPDIAAKINATYQFELSGEGGGSWIVDLKKPSDWVSAGTSESPTVTIMMTAADFVALVSGKLNGQMAFMTGKLKLKGDVGLALKLQQILGT
ncbi:MAG: SCP2 sterol-binding domain-containing protein [Deltaproteobacteria bacterium]|nr:SCP2 sterol-binding domain-containing protein [Deltaproteobacteria bacterium]